MQVVGVSSVSANFSVCFGLAAREDTEAYMYVVFEKQPGCTITTEDKKREDRQGRGQLSGGEVCAFLRGKTCEVRIGRGNVITIPDAEVKTVAGQVFCLPKGGGDRFGCQPPATQTPWVQMTLNTGKSGASQDSGASPLPLYIGI